MESGVYWNLRCAVRRPKSGKGKMKTGTQRRANINKSFGVKSYWFSFDPIIFSMNTTRVSSTSGILMPSESIYKFPICNKFSYSAFLHFRSALNSYWSFSYACSIFTDERLRFPTPKRRAAERGKIRKLFVHKSSKLIRSGGVNNVLRRNNSGK